MPKTLEQLSQKEIRTQLLYCKDDPVRTFILSERLKWLTQKKIEQTVQAKPQLPIPSPEEPIPEESIDDLLADICGSDEGSSDDDLSQLEEYLMQEQSMQKQPVQKHKNKKRLISKDMLNNGLMQRLNAEMQMKRNSNPADRNRFETPFGVGPTDNLTSVQEVTHQAPSSFLNPGEWNK